MNIDRITKNDCLKLIKQINKKYEKAYPGENKEIELVKLETRERLIVTHQLHGESMIKYADLFGVYHHLEDINSRVDQIL